MNPLGPGAGIAIEVALGLLLLALVYYVKVKLVSSTDDFVIANRKIGFGFGVAGLISIWTWAMAVMMSAAMTYTFGLSGLFWFTVPNGLAVIAVIPFARRVRQLMPEGYTIPEFVKARFGGARLAVVVVVLGALFGSLIEVIINIKGTALVVSNVFGVDPRLAALVGLAVVLLYSILGGLWASISTSTLTPLFIPGPSAVVIVAALPAPAARPRSGRRSRRRGTACSPWRAPRRRPGSASRSRSGSSWRPWPGRSSGRRPGPSSGRT